MNISQLQSSPYINRSSFVQSANAVQRAGLANLNTAQSG